MQSVNPAFAAMHGGTVEDFVGRRAESLLTQDGDPLYRIAWFEDLSERRGGRG
jgi:hypothetical protein